MLGHTVAFCCLVRSLGGIAHLTVERIKSLGSLFSGYSAIIIENDSDDNTATILEEWAAGDRNIAVHSEQLGVRRYSQTRCLERASYMSGLRNMYLEILRRRQGLPDYVIVLDTDLQGGWSEDGIASTFGYEDWDAVGSNGLSVWQGKCEDGSRTRSLTHFDTWAFRRYGKPEAEPHSVVSNYAFCRGEPMVRVFSCFGGLAVYRSEAMESAFYSGEDCEHVPFYRRMQESGFDRIFLNPSQIVLYSPLADMRSLGDRGDPRISLNIV